MAVDYDELTNLQKIAAFLIVIGSEAASQMIKYLEPSQIEPICKEMTALQVIDEKTQARIMDEFSVVVTGGLNSALGGAAFAQNTLANAKRDPNISHILDRLSPENQNTDGENDIRRMNARMIVNLVKSEQPQTIAFILSCLDTPKAAETVTFLPPELRDEVVERLAAMEETSQDIVNKIAKNLNRHLGSARPVETDRRGGIKPVVDILNALEREMRKSLLARIEERNAPLGAAIRKKVFSFDDVMRLDSVNLQRLLRDVDMGELAVAMKSSKPPQINAVCGAMSKRAAQGFREEIDMLPQQKAKAVEAIQDKVVQIALKLEEAEEISFNSGAEEHAT